MFGHDRRTERLLDGITRRWRYIGPIYLIAGRDVALRTVDPQDFYSFLSGRLSRAFVKDEADLAARLSVLDRDPDPDGRYRINQFFCHQNTWKAVLDELIQRSAAVLMDLRGFDAARLGCRYELTRLGEHLGAKPVVLLADASTDRDLVALLLRQGQAMPAPLARPPERHAYLLDAGTRSGARLLAMATRLLLGAQPDSPARARAPARSRAPAQVECRTAQNRPAPIAKDRPCPAIVAHGREPRLAAQAARFFTNPACSLV